jgi:hypothetical protein
VIILFLYPIPRKPVIPEFEIVIHQLTQRQDEDGQEGQQTNERDKGRQDENQA